MGKALGGFSMDEYKKFLKWEKPSIICAWLNIVVFILFIFPLGIYAYWKRSKVDKTTTLHTWKLLVGFGVAIMITGLRIFAMSGGAVINVLIGLALVVAGLYMRKLAFVRMDIIGCLLVKREFNVRNIARIVGKSEKVVYNEIDNMMKKGMLPGVIVDAENNEIIVPGYSGDNMQEYVERVYGVEEEKEEPVPEIKNEEELEQFIDSKRANNINKHPLKTGICAACGEKMTEEAIAAKKCQVCGRVYEDPEEDANYY